MRAGIASGSRYDYPPVYWDRLVALIGDHALIDAEKPRPAAGPHDRSSRSMPSR
jgi:hypothetical protein